ncbi:TPA: hypothetical protein DDW35_11110 [Candidatus Sumerlaeota bacterium]|jgi:hypothetical protein|nr:hypothetical protein [Candidatus Sumerlaeota bacterium]
MFEKKHHKVLPLHRFAWRMAVFIAWAQLLVLGALLLGVGGYHWIAQFSWVDSILNASMILAGMGPMGELKSDGAKLFAAAYALFSGLVFILLMGVMLAPILHRVLHMFHVDETDLQVTEPHKNNGGRR